MHSQGHTKMFRSYQSILPTHNKLLQMRWDQTYYKEHRRLVSLLKIINMATVCQPYHVFATVYELGYLWLKLVSSASAFSFNWLFYWIECLFQIQSIFLVHVNIKSSGLVLHVCWILVCRTMIGHISHLYHNIFISAGHHRPSIMLNMIGRIS